METTYIYACISDNCKRLENEEYLSNGQQFYVDKDESLKDEVENCPFCGGVLKRIGEKAFSVGKFNSLSPNQKQQVLKQRSREHFKKEVEESFHAKNRKKF